AGRPVKLKYPCESLTASSFTRGSNADALTRAPAIGSRVLAASTLPLIRPEPVGRNGCCAATTSPEETTAITPNSHLLVIYCVPPGKPDSSGYGQAREASRNIRLASPLHRFLACSPENRRDLFGVVAVELVHRQSVIHQGLCTAFPIAIALVVVTRSERERSVHVVPVAMRLGPTCAMFEQKASQLGVAIKDRLVQRRRLPPSTSNRNRPSQLHHHSNGRVVSSRR